MKKKLLIFSLVLLLIVKIFPDESDNSNWKDNAPNLYLQSNAYIDTNYLKNQMEFVNYVTEQTAADIFLIIDATETAGGGMEYTFKFSGQKGFKGKDWTLKYSSKSTDSGDIIKKEIVKTIKKGLYPYLLSTPLSDFISLSYRKPVKKGKVTDPWKGWLFNIGISSYLNGEEKSKNSYFDGNLSVSNINEKNKFRLSVYLNYNENSYDLGDSEILKSISRYKSVSGMYAYGLNDHWSIGGYLSGSSSSYSNLNYDLVIRPAIEFNIYPYSDFSTRALKLRYSLSTSYNDYIEETIYNRMNEILYNESLNIGYYISGIWGKINLNISASNYLHDFSKNHFNIYSNFSIKVLKGLSLSFYGGINFIHDQLSLTKGSATDEEILLRRKELATQYSYYSGFSINYSFGSIYNNAVNTRF